MKTIIADEDAFRAEPAACRLPPAAMENPGRGELGRALATVSNDHEAQVQAEADVRDESLEQKKLRFRREFSGSLVAPSVSFLVEEIFDWMEAEKPFESHRPAAYTPTQSAVGIEQFARLMVHKGYNPGLLNRVMLWCLDLPALDDVLNHEYPAIWARQYGLSRYAVIKIVEVVQTELGLQKRREQKDPAARDKMSKRRRKQLVS